MEIIKHRQIVSDGWQRIETTEGALPGGDIIVPLALWRERRAELLARAGNLGVQLEPDTDLETIAADLAHFAVIALHFPSFRDGRGYSLARQLRTHYGYRGELRAVGDVLRDQIYFMERVGIDAFEMHPRHDIHDALKAFGELSVQYQGSSDNPLPLYRRGR